ncbi:MAG: hypothetical protein ACC628_09925 [Pirellulaceae bacterium]
MTRISILLRLLLVGIAGGTSLPLSAQGLDPDFKPELVGVEFTSRQIRPGDPFAMTIKFRNGGTQPARSDYWLFVHFEAPEKDCRNIVIHADHAPTEPTSLWQPEKIIVDGPRVLTAPANLPDQEYYVHIGVYDHPAAGQRLLETYDGGKIHVTSQAPPASEMGPEPFPPTEVMQRRQALRSRIPAIHRASVDRERWRFDIDKNSGAWALTDKATGVLWTSNPGTPRFGEVLLRNGDQAVLWRIDRFDGIRESPEGLELVAKPLLDGRPSGVILTFTVKPTPSLDGIELSYTSETAGAWRVARVRLLQRALTVTDKEAGRLYVPHRLGLERSAGKGLPGDEHWRTYDGLSMAMCGAVKDGSALLVNWDNVDTRLTASTTWPDLPLVPGRRACSVSLDIEAPEGRCSLHPLGRGGYVEIAHAYREMARSKGWLVPWSEKRKRFPSVGRLFGAANFKPFVLARVMPGSRFSPDGKERVHRSFTFDEVAACAEHWRHDLEIDRAYVVIAGWIHGGYDVRHPDVLPACPECGGNEGLAEAARRIKDCGYLFGLHDNYQDMYEDAASWDEAWLNKDARGVSKKGGNWYGGQAWQVCAIKQVELAARNATNLPEIARLFSPSIYFIDTVFAWPLVSCEDPRHPMTRLEDLRWKSRLSLLAKDHFGLFGSEEGREWSVPCADYLEGIFGQQTDASPGSVIPLFPLVYSDCVQIMTHQGNRIGPGDEKKIADHILFAEMFLPRFGNGRYWTGGAPVPIVPLAPTIESRGARTFRITYHWMAREPVRKDYQVFVHFTQQQTDRPEGIAFQDDHAPTRPTSQWRSGEIIDDGPYTVEIPESFRGEARIQLGMLLDGQRVRLASGSQRGLRYHVGTLAVSDGELRHEAAATASSELWTRGDRGWGADLGRVDRVIKNVWEVLSPLNRITAELPLASHEFLTPDRLVQRTRFGDVTITVAYERTAEMDDQILPAHGFLVESPQFVAFCALRYNGINYEQPAMFTVRSLDGQPIAESSRVRIYHGFGDPTVRIAGQEFKVEREAVVRGRGS